jgi:hypothetical protein
MRPYIKGEDLSKISVSPTDNPETDMGMIARNPDNHYDQWYVARKYFEENLELVDFTNAGEPTSSTPIKTLHNSDVSGARQNVKDIKVVGNGDMFMLLCKASSQAEGWMKSTKAMEIQGAGCLVQVTTQQRNPDGSYAVAEAMAFVHSVRISSLQEDGGRYLYWPR